MAKSIGLSRFLLYTAVCICIGTPGYHVRAAGPDFRTDNLIMTDAWPGKYKSVKPVSYPEPAYWQTTSRIKSVYDSQIGVREKGSNAGPEVEAYLKYVGLKKGNAWCAAFVCWVLGRAGISNPYSGWSPDLFRKERVIWLRNQSVVPDTQRKLNAKSNTSAGSTADVFGIWFKDKNRIAHCGFIDSSSDSWIITVEGNTNDEGGRDGDGVYRKRRLLSSIYAIARYAQ